MIIDELLYNFYVKKIKFIISSDYSYITEIKILIDTINKYHPDAQVLLFTTEDTKSFLSKLGFKNVKFNTSFITEELYSRFSKSLGMKNNLNSIFRFGRIIFINSIPKDKNCTYIYLDSDTFLNGSIEEKYLNSKYNFAFRQDEYNTERYRITLNFWSKVLKEYPKIFNKVKLKMKSENYFNSGVLIINNLKKYKKLAKKCIKSKYKINDQSLLNYYNKKNFKVVVDCKYNSMLDRHNDIAIIYHYPGISNIIQNPKARIANKEAQLLLEKMIKKWI